MLDHWRMNRATEPPSQGPAQNAINLFKGAGFYGGPAKSDGYNNAECVHHAPNDTQWTAVQECLNGSWFLLGRLTHWIVHHSDTHMRIAYAADAARPGHILIHFRHILVSFSVRFQFRRIPMLTVFFYCPAMLQLFERIVSRSCIHTYMSTAFDIFINFTCFVLGPIINILSRRRRFFARSLSLSAPNETEKQFIYLKLQSRTRKRKIFISFIIGQKIIFCCSNIRVIKEILRARDRERERERDESAATPADGH